MQTTTSTITLTSDVFILVWLVLGYIKIKGPVLGITLPLDKHLKHQCWEKFIQKSYLIANQSVYITAIQCEINETVQYNVV